MSFTETVRLKLYWNTTYTTEPDGTITVQRDAPDGYLIIDRMLDFSELVDKTWLICGDVVAPHNPSRVFRQFGYHQRIPGDALLLTAAEITSLLKRKPFGGSDRRWLQQLGIYLQVWNDRHGQVVGTDDLYVGEPSADPEYLLWYHQVTVKYVTDPTDSENARGFHGSAETLRLMARLPEFFERALSVNATNVVRHDLDRHVEVHDILSQELAPVDPTQQHPPPRPPRRSRRSQRGRGGKRQSQHLSHIGPPGMSGLIFPSPAVHPIGLHIVSTPFSTTFSSSVSTSFIPSVSTSFFADPSAFYRPIMSPKTSSLIFLHSLFLPDFSASGYQRHEERWIESTLGTPPLAVSKGQRVTKEPDRLTYSLFRAKKPKKK
ncbi:OLC1v1016019C1 [Oldenlandia corymbosa var. corymbosa]|uniref:OLC1v1016019C1 n=1 Tax=Oldenlandia corymbosa var. corymbosa TaxID=529605 RepID=A0AAV1E4V1_OLDCO|nr:OLC1v1016019C1 [Oldenlandia corymbosa var. corymbosa]